jgi:hypothetical protein
MGSRRVSKIIDYVSARRNSVFRVFKSLEERTSSLALYVGISVDLDGQQGKWNQKFSEDSQFGFARKGDQRDPKNREVKDH